MKELIQKTTFGKRILMRDFRRAFNIKQDTLAKAINKEQSTIVYSDERAPLIPVNEHHLWISF